jgi:hypothetical protein
MKSLDGAAWTLIAMLADLSDDCTRFLRRLDRRHLDPVTAAEAIVDFKEALIKDYINGL